MSINRLEVYNIVDNWFVFGTWTIQSDLGTNVETERRKGINVRAGAAQRDAIHGDVNGFGRIFEPIVAKVAVVASFVGTWRFNAIARRGESMLVHFADVGTVHDRRIYRGDARDGDQG